jgi:thioredoxin 2
METQVILCPACGAANRVSLDRIQAQMRPLCGRCKTPLSVNSQPIVVTDANFHEVVELSSLPVLLDMWAEWCGPCHMLAPTVNQLAGELAGKVVVGKLNVDENPGTSSRFNVRSIPTLLFLKNGREVDRIVGVKPKAEILRKISMH